MCGVISLWLLKILYFLSQLTYNLLVSGVQRGGCPLTEGRVGWLEETGIWHTPAGDAPGKGGGERSRKRV